jgi:hypothetical protein
MTRYYRSKTGKIVHWHYCERKGETAVPWVWAERKSDRRIVQEMARNGVRPCRVCSPPLWPAVAYLKLVSGGD